MTTDQDPPLSRRQIREREAAAARAAEGAHTTGAPVATHASAEPLNAEPLSYVTQQRAPLPQYEAPAPQPSAPLHSAPPVAGQQAPADAAAAYQYRDFSPEGRRAARQGWQQPTEAADLDYQTQNRAPSAPPQQVPDAAPAPQYVAPEPVVPEPVAPSAAPVASFPEGTMSRRELRALREQQEREQQASAAPVAPVTPVAEPVTPQYSDAPVAPQPSVAPVAEPLAAQTPVEPPPLVEPEAPQVDAMASLEALFRAQASAAPVAAAPEALAPELFTPAPVAPEQYTPQPVAPEAYVPEPVAPEQYAPQHYPAEQYTPAPSAPETYTLQPVAPEPFTPEPFMPEQLAPAAYTPEPFTPEPVAPEQLAPAVWDISTPDAPEQPAETVLPPWGGLTPGVPATGSAAPVTSTAPQPVTPQPVISEPVISQPVAPQPAEPASFPAAEGLLSHAYGAPAPHEAAWAPQPTPASEAPVTTSQPPVGERPRNHWSRQAELDDEAQPMTGSIVRDVAANSVTSNTLVIDEVPSPDIIMSPVRSTGDILVTGSISLPASLASTGALSTQFDESDLDNLLDAGDQQVVSTDSQPVRAIRAVSTHTSSREIIGAARPRRGNRALTALIVAAAGMAVVVVTLLVVALSQGMLN